MPRKNYNIPVKGKMLCDIPLIDKLYAEHAESVRKLNDAKLYVISCEVRADKAVRALHAHLDKLAADSRRAQLVT